TGEQVPSLPGTLHASHCPVHAPSQQRPSTQRLLAHWAALVHAAPCGKEQVPVFGARSHRMPAGHDDDAQQTPFTHAPEAQSCPITHAPPFAIGANSSDAFEPYAVTVSSPPVTSTPVLTTVMRCPGRTSV